MVKGRGAVFLVLVGLFLLSGGTPAQAYSCNKVTPKVDFRVTLDAGETRYFQTKTAARIDQENRDDGGKGLMPGRSEALPWLQVSATAIKEKWGKGKYCAYADWVRVRLRVSWFSVYIPKEYKKGSCEYRAVKAAQDRLVGRYRKTLKAYKAKARKAIAGYIQKKPRAKVRHPEDANTAVRKKIEKKLQPTRRKLEKALARASKNFDQLVSAKQVRTRCQNWGKS